MWELDCEESWVPKTWCFWTVVLEKTLESPLDCKEIQPVHSKGDQSCVFFGRNDAKAETPVLWPPHWELIYWKRLWCWEGLGAGREGDDRGWDGWMASPSRWTWVLWILRVGDWQGGLACCNSWHHKESDMTERLNWTELNTLNCDPYLFNTLVILNLWCTLEGFTELFKRYQSLGTISTELRWVQENIGVFKKQVILMFSQCLELL